MAQVWKPTHAVWWTPEGTRDSERTDVMLCADQDGHGPAYTREEWEACDNAYLELTRHGWLFAGDATPGCQNGEVYVEEVE